MYFYFRDYELNFVCKDLCYDDLVDCALICGDDTICLADCARIEAECIEGDSFELKLGSGWDNARVEILETTYYLKYCELKFLILYSDCPCDIDCIQGCVDCPNPICVCSDRKNENDHWNACMDQHGSRWGRCIDKCDGNRICEDDCVVQFKEAKKSCPCEVSNHLSI